MKKYSLVELKMEYEEKIRIACESNQKDELKELLKKVRNQSSIGDRVSRTIVELLLEYEKDPTEFTKLMKSLIYSKSDCVSCSFVLAGLEYDIINRLDYENFSTGTLLRNFIKDEVFASIIVKRFDIPKEIILDLIAHGLQKPEITLVLIRDNFHTFDQKDKIYLMRRILLRTNFDIFRFLFESTELTEQEYILILNEAFCFNGSFEVIQYLLRDPRMTENIGSLIIECIVCHAESKTIKLLINDDRYDINDDIKTIEFYLNGIDKYTERQDVGIFTTIIKKWNDFSWGDHRMIYSALKVAKVRDYFKPLDYIMKTCWWKDNEIPEKLLMEVNEVLGKRKD